MNVGVLGLGRMGLVLAEAFAATGRYDTYGWDIDLAGVEARLANPVEDMPTVGFQLSSTLDEFVTSAELIFVCVQTPHPPGYDGSTPLDKVPTNFDYTYLVDAITRLALVAHQRQLIRTVGIMSTVAPGAIAAHIMNVPHREYLNIVYCPSFISLGTIYHDLCNPRLILIGSNDEATGNFAPSSRVTVALRLLATGSEAPVVHTTIEEAELAKMASNGLQSLKIGYINHLAEIADRMNINIDRVTGALRASKEVAWIPHAGMVDGGACRPRDLVTMSWFEQHCDTSTAMFTYLNMQRDEQAQRLAERVTAVAYGHSLGVCVLGKTYKPGVPYREGSPADLLRHNLDALATLHTVDQWDPDVDGPREFRHPWVFVVATPHEAFKVMDHPWGSIVIDPWNIVTRRIEGVRYIFPGREH